jgi:hypothetical protein
VIRIWACDDVAADRNAKNKNRLKRHLKSMIDVSKKRFNGDEKNLIYQTGCFKTGRTLIRVVETKRQKKKQNEYPLSNIDKNKCLKSFR